MNSEIKLPVSEIRNVLPGFSKVVNRSSTLPVLQSVRLIREKAGSVSLQATDLDTFVTYRLMDEQPGEDLDVLLPLDQLQKMAKAASSKDNISLIQESKNLKLRYLLSGSPVEQSVKSVPIKEWPTVPQIHEPAMAMEQAFGSALKQALECSSDDPSRHVLRGACLDVTDKKFHYVVGTNGRILFSANSFCFDLKKPVIIPASKFLDWTDLLDQGCQLSVRTGDGKTPVSWVKLESPRWSLIAKQIDGNYPNWKQVLPKPDDKWTHVLLGEQAIKQLLAVVPKMPGQSDPDRPIRLRTGLGGLMVESRSRHDQEWTSIPVQDTAVKGADVFVHLNREFLIKAVRFGLKHLEINDELSPILFWNGGQKMVVMPLRGHAPANHVPTTSPLPAAEVKKADLPEPALPQQPQPKPETTHERTTMTRQEAGQPVIEKETGIKPLVEKVDRIRDTLKEVARELVEVAEGLKQAEKEKRASDKEIEGFRASLRKIQSFSI